MNTFENYPDLANFIADKIAEQFAEPAFEIERGYSNQSCSTYLNVMFMEADEDGDFIDSFGSFKLRVSDHDDRYGSDHTVRIDTHNVDEIKDECGEFSHIEAHEDFIADFIAEGVAAIKGAYQEQK